MSPEPVISVQGVGKQYILYDRPEDRLKHTLFWRFGRHYGRPFWALHDISFEVGRGETFGVIGKNGSGKSTLLQILAGTLNPTTGTARMNGRVSALLELGSGFNPEYTGRENVFLNGAILGMTKPEIRKKFDEIVAFSEVEQFIDTPVKYYSSGMFVRLAFSVSVHLTPEILLLDEILAVGDSGFQHKSREKMKQLLGSGATIIFVSHNDQAVREICKRAIWLDKGQIRLDGHARDVIREYQECVNRPEHEPAAPVGKA